MFNLVLFHLDNKSNFQLELDNAFLSQQNEHLNKELCLARYTINALKGITTQKEEALNETRLELEKALQHIQLLTVTLKSKHNSVDFDNELSDDLSEEEELLVERRSIDIMSKLPLRPYLIHNENNNIYDDAY